MVAQTNLPVVYMTGQFGKEYSLGKIVVKDTLGEAIDSLVIRAKYRGSTAQGFDKKSYSVKVYNDQGESMDVSFLGMRSDNNWILDAMAADKARMRNRIAFDIWRDMKPQPYYFEQEPKAKLNTEGRFVELYINDEYHGIYCFTEKIDRKQLKLKKFKDEEIRGLLYKGVSWNGTQWYDAPDVFDNTSDRFMGFECKYPELDDLGYVDWQPLSDKMTFVLKSSDEEFLHRCGEEFDLPALRDLFLLINVACAIDNSGKNQYFFIHDKSVDNKLSFAPWDMDASFGRSYDGSLNSQSSEEIYGRNYLVNRLMSLSPEFCIDLSERYFSLREGVFSTDSLKSRFSTYFSLFEASGAGEREQERWNNANDIAIDFVAEEPYIQNFIDNHILVLDNYFRDILETAAIRKPLAYERKDNSYYNLNGQRIEKPLSGHIYIYNGKKIRGN